jgi:hypothetical protein
MADLQERTGLNVYRISIDRINFMRDTARIRLFYRHEPTDDLLVNDKETPTPAAKS